MQDINFIPGSGGSKRSNRSQGNSDIQYTSGEAFAAQKKESASKKKPIAKKPRPPKAPKASKPPKKKATKKKKLSFFEWRKQKELSAQEQAEVEERIVIPKPTVKKAIPKMPVAHLDAHTEQGSSIYTPAHIEQRNTVQMHAAPAQQMQAELKPDLLHAQNASEVLAKKQLLHVAQSGVPTAPASNLLEGKVYSMPVSQDLPDPNSTSKKGGTNKKSGSKKSTGRTARIHIPPTIEKHQAKKHWLTLKKQEQDTTVFDVNLIPTDVLAELQTRNYLRELLYVAIAGVMIVLIIFAALNVYQRKIATDTAVLETQIQEFDREIAGYIGLQTEVTDLSQRLASVQQVLNAHVYWTPFLRTLEQLTLSTVYYQSMSGTAETGNFVFEAYAKTYRDIDAQVRVLRQSPVVRSVTVNSAATTQTTSDTTETTTETEGAEAVAFDLTVEFDPTLFQYPNANDSEL